MKKKWDNVYKYNSTTYRVILILVAISLITYWLPKGGQFNYEYQEGKPWLFEDLVSPFDFAISKSEDELKSEENEVKANAKLYFVFDEEVKDVVFGNFYKKINRLGSERAFDERYLEKMYVFGENQLQIIYKNGILAKNENLKIVNKKRKVVLLINNVASDVVFENIYTVNSAMEFIDQRIHFSEFEEDKAFLDEVFLGVLQQNVSYDAGKTQKGIEKDLDKISRTRGFVAHNTRIISKGDIVGGESLDKLNSLKAEHESQVLSESSYLWITIGHVIKVSVLIIMLMLFLSQFKNDIYDDDNKTSFIYFNILLMVGLASLVIHYDPKLIYVVPVSIVPIILKSFFDSRLGLIAHIIIVLLIGFMAPNGFEYAFIQISAGIVTVLSVSSDHRRASMFISVGQITLIYFITYFGYSISQKGDLSAICN